MESPAYDKYLRVINETLLSAGKQLSESLAAHLTGEHKAVLDEFLDKKATYQNADIVAFKTINQSSRPSEIARSLAQFIVLKSRLERLKVLIEQRGSLRCHYRLSRLLDDDCRYRQNSRPFGPIPAFALLSDSSGSKRHDFFIDIDIVLDGVKSAENATKRLQESCFCKSEATYGRYPAP